MNIAKKLLFSLLLCGSVFAAACGDDGKTAAAGATCDAETSCEANLVCVVDNDSATSGTCKATCNENSDCTSGNMTSCDDAKVLKDTTAGKVCMKPGTNGQNPPPKSQDGGDCSAASGKQCDTGLVCVSDLCQPSCTTVGSADAVCTAHDTKKECVEENSVKYCKVPSTKKGEDEACTADDTCDDSLVCAGPNGSKTCQPSCTTVGLADAVCSAHGTKKECVEENSVKYCKVPAPTPKNDGDPCSSATDCNDSKLACVTEGTNNVCRPKCTADTDCSAPKPTCDLGVDSTTIDSQTVHLCKA